MKISLTSWIASRYLWSRNSGRFAPLLTATAVASVAVGVMALITVMSVMRGFRNELADRLTGFNSHITITKSPDAEDIPVGEIEGLFDGISVRDVAPYVQGEVIAQSVSGGELVAQGARVRGVDSAHLGAIERVDFYFPEGSAGFAALESNGSDSAKRSVIVGHEIVGQLLVHPDFGDVLELIAPLAEVGPNGELVPNRMRFNVEGVFRAGVYDYDSKYVLVSLDDARRLLGEQVEEGWLIRLADSADVPEAMIKVRERLPAGWKAAGLDTQNRKLFAALALERVAMGGILVMVLLIASCAIAGVVMLITSAKRKDVAILRSIGMGAKSVRRIFIANAAIVGGTGSLTGLALGLLVSLGAKMWPIRLPDTYYLDYLPVEIDPLASIVFAVCGCMVAMVASLYPISSVSRMNVVDVLRYE